MSSRGVFVIFALVVLGLAAYHFAKKHEATSAVSSNESHIRIDADNPNHPVADDTISTRDQDGSPGLGFGKSKTLGIEPAKISSSVQRLVESYSANNLTRNHAFWQIDAQNRLQVYVTLSSFEPQTILRLETLGVEIEVLNEKAHLMQGRVHIENIEPLAEMPDVIRIDLPKYAHSSRGSRTTEGDTLLIADQLRKLGYSGRGIKIGIISDGATDFSSAVSSGDLPASLQTFGSCQKRSASPSGCRSEWNCNEGTAMAEIVYDIAPNVSIAVGAAGTTLEFIQRVYDLANDFRADVIVDDLGFFSEPFFEDGSVADAVASVSDTVIFVSAAGNAADRHYEADFSPMTYNFDGSEVIVHNFSDGFFTDPSMNVSIAAGGYIVAFLQWNDRFDSSSNDFDLNLVNNAEDQLLNYSWETQSGFSDPIEAFCQYNGSNTTQTYKIAIDKVSGANRRLELFTFGLNSATEYNVPEGSIFGHSGLNDVISVGAANASSPSDVTYYSSRGPSRIDFPFRLDRQKPNVTGIDGVSVTGTGGFSSTFYGTSAAAPHVAAIAALLLEAAPSATPAVIAAALENNAVDIESFGFDSLAGMGRVDALAALSDLNMQVMDSDGDGFDDDQDDFPNDPTEHLDTDSDGVGNVADVDDDNDGVLDTYDAFPLDASETVDIDGDGIGDNADPLVESAANVVRAYLVTNSASINESFVHIINNSSAPQIFQGSLYSGEGIRLGSDYVNLSNEAIPSGGRLVLTATDLEKIFNVSSWKGPAMLEVFGSDDFQAMIKLKSPSGFVSSSNCVTNDRVHNIEGFEQSDQTYIRFINIGSSAIEDITGTLLDKNGAAIGSGNVQLLTSLAPKAQIWLNRSELSEIVGSQWQEEATLVVSYHPNLRLLNLNFVNSETFFNFSCLEQSIDADGSSLLIENLTGTWEGTATALSISDSSCTHSVELEAQLSGDGFFSGSATHTGYGVTSNFDGLVLDGGYLLFGLLSDSGYAASFSGFFSDTQTLAMYARDSDNCYSVFTMGKQ